MFSKTASAAIIASLAVVLASCGGSGSDDGNPTTPTRPAAALSLSTFTASVTQDAGGNRYVIRATVRESGGQTGASLGAVELTFSDDIGDVGKIISDNAWTSSRVAPGSSVNSAVISTSDSREGRRLATRVTARVSYTDDTQARGALTATADITQQAPSPSSAGHIPARR